MDPKLLSTIIAIAKKEASANSVDISNLQGKVEKQLKEFHSRSPILETPEFFVKGGCLHCKWQSGLTLNFGNIVGPQGAKGDKGEQGIQGIPGVDGAIGYNGKDGLDGRDGIDGKQGKDGSNGIDGKDGQRGPEGAPGEPGEVGQQGVPGNDGKDGERGPMGLSGNDGLDGEDGVGVDKVWVDDKYHLTIKLTSGKVIDAGYVRGQAGTSSGKGGRVTGGYTGGGSGSNFYVTNAAYDANGDLIITMSNGQTVTAEPYQGQGIVYIQDDQPTSTNPYLWIETNVNTDGDFSFWFNNC